MYIFIGIKKYSVVEVRRIYEKNDIRTVFKSYFSKAHLKPLLSYVIYSHRIYFGLFYVKHYFKEYCAI